MAVISIPIPESGLSIEQLADLLAQVIKEVQWLVNGNLDVNNIRANTITADRMKVSQLSAIAADLGTITAGQIFGAFIATAQNTYPRVELSNTNNLLAAYQDSTHYVQVKPILNNAPTVSWESPQTSLQIFVNPDTTGNATISNSGGRIDINSANNVRFNTAPSGTLQVPDSSNNIQNGASGTITYVKNVSGGVPSFGTITVTKGLITAFT